MGFLQQLFYTIFAYVYPIVHSPLISYVLIFGLFLGLTYLNWKWIKSIKKPKTIFAKGLKWLLLAIELFLALFLLWYVFIHFHTFTLIGQIDASL